MRIFEELRDRIQGKAPKGKRRSRAWKTVRAHYLKANPKCAVCESTKSLEIHHILPFHIAPDKELDPANLMTLCENKKYGINCHLLIGHLGNYRRVNLQCQIDVVVWNMKIKGK